MSYKIYEFSMMRMRAQQPILAPSCVVFNCLCAASENFSHRPMKTKLMWVGGWLQLNLGLLVFFFFQLQTMNIFEDDFIFNIVGKTNMKVLY